MCIWLSWKQGIESFRSLSQYKTYFVYLANKEELHYFLMVVLHTHTHSNKFPRNGEAINACHTITLHHYILYHV